MVNGMPMFTEWFKDYQDQFVLIGGTAASITLNEAGLNFRRTKDLDIVLHLEALTPAFAENFWAFIEAGGYKLRQTSQQERPKMYRFSHPKDDEFPFMIELFCRAPNMDGLAPGHLVPLPITEDISSLSAILLNDDYYQFIMDGRQFKDGMPPWIGVDRLIPLKAHAWLDMTTRKAAGDHVDSNDIRKHLNDIVRLTGLLNPSDKVGLPETLASDMRSFVTEAAAIDSTETQTALNRITQAFL